MINNKQSIISIKQIIIVLSLLLSSCAKDFPTDDTRKFNSENEWILTTMRENYLYREYMPKSPNLNKPTKNFFNSLLSTKDGKHNDEQSHFYSYIESDTRSNSSSELFYGFRTTNWLLTDGTKI